MKINKLEYFGKQDRQAHLSVGRDTRKNFYLAQSLFVNEASINKSMITCNDSFIGVSVAETWILLKRYFLACLNYI